jgi:Galactose oxidase-like, Early set domain
MPVTQFLPIPDWFSWDNQGADLAAASLANDGTLDLIVFMIDNPGNQNAGLYRIGRTLDANGIATGGWTPWINVPDWFSWENQGGGIALADLDQDGHQDLVILMVNSTPGQNLGLFRVGRKLDVFGNVTGGWTDWIEVPDWFSWENQDAAIAMGPSDAQGRCDLYVFMIDNAAQGNRGVYRIGRKLDANGNVTGGWTGWIDVPDWFSWENQGAGIAVADLDGNGSLDLIVFHIDNAAEQNQAFFRIGKGLDANGIAAQGWGDWLGVPHWFSWENQGGGIAVATLNGAPKLLVLMVDNPPNNSSGQYQVLDLKHDPAEYGRWELLPYHSGVLAVHAAVLPKGKVLFFAGSGSSRTRFESPDFGDVAKGFYMSVVWDPLAPATNNANFFHPATLRTTNGKPFDFFCAGHSFLTDGRLLVAGGTLLYKDFPLFTGRNDCVIFDPVTNLWSFAASMTHGRWYPTLITLSDGRILAASGLTEVGTALNENLEIYSPANNTWQLQHIAGNPEVFQGLPLYAHLFLLEDGRVFFTGGRMDDARPTVPCIIDLTQNPAQTQPVQDLLEPDFRNQSASVILPPAQNQKVMIFGGGPVGKPDKRDAVDKVSVVDLTGPAPNYVASPPMCLARLHLNAVLLPDHTVFVSGGSLKQEDEPLSRRQAELYDPATDSWRLMATATVPRLYHSTAVLLPDGRVVAAGGNPEGGKSVAWEPPDPDEEMRLEIFSPPYLFKGPRPVIGTAVEKWNYGQTITITTPNAGNIRWVSIICNGVTTHSFNCSQRLVDLDIVAQAAGSINATITNNPNLAPPGWYMLFIVNQQGVPSVAKWIHLT